MRADARHARQLNDGGRVSAGRRRDLLRTVCMAQGLYYAATGVWPLVHMRSFLAVTGPKRDLWLVRTVGALITVMGASLIYSARRRRRVPREVRALAIGGAAALTLVDATYVARGTIPPIYLLDAAAEVGLMGAWGLASRGRARRPGGPRRVRRGVLTPRSTRVQGAGATGSAAPPGARDGW